MTVKPAAAALALLAATALAGCSPTAGSVPAGPLNIGLVTSLTGIDLGLGVDVRLGAQQAVAEVNGGGGVSGRLARLLVADDRSSAPEAGTAFDGLVTRGAAGVIGPPDAAAAVAIVAHSTTRRTPILSTSGADQLTRSPAGTSANVFLAAPAAGRSAQAMLTFARAKSLKTIAVAHPAGDILADSGVKALKLQGGPFGIQIVSDQSFDPGMVDFKVLLDAVRASGADLLIAWGGGSGPPLLERAWKDSGLTVPILFSPASATTSFLRALSDSGDGSLVLTTESLLAPARPASSPVHARVDAMASAFQRRNGYYPTQAAFDGYAAARLLLKAIDDAGSTDPARVDDALSRLKLTTAAGSFSFGGGDHLGLPASWLVVAKVEGGKLSPAG